MTITWVRKQDNAWQSSTGVTVFGVDKRIISDCPQIQVSSGYGSPGYSSDAPSIVTIDPDTGEIGLQGRPGQARITARLSNGDADSYTITVQETEVVISFPDYPSSSASMEIGNQFNLNPNAKSKVAGADVVTNFTYTTSSSVVTVSNTGHVTAGQNPGTATVTVTLDSTQYTAQQATFVIQVLASQSDAVVVNPTIDSSVITVADGAKPTCTISAEMTINGKKPSSVAYSYAVPEAFADIATVDATSGVVTSKSKAGVLEVEVTAIVSNTDAEYPGVVGVAIAAITVVAADGDASNPRPKVSYPAYSGSQPPTIDAVKALLKALMASGADTPDDTTTQNIDESNNIVVAQKLFGFDYDYFNAVATDGSGKKMVFTINESNKIYQASSTATSHLQLKVAKELVLGDNISFSFTRGNTFSVNVNLNDKADRAGQDNDHDGIDDSIQTGHGVTNTSITGIASALTLDAKDGTASDLYQYPADPTGTPTDNTNHVYLPRLKTLKLDYGNINSYRADRAISIEFMGLDGDELDASRCSYASFQLVSRNLFHPHTDSDALTGVAESPNIGASELCGQDTKGTSLYDPGIVIAPDEKNLGLLQDYFQGSGTGDGYMGQYDKIGLPREFLADSAIDSPGVNILQFTRGKSRLIYEYLDGMIKQYWLADQLVATTIIAAVRVAVAMVFLHKLDYFQANYNNHNNAALNLNTRLQPLDAGFDIRYWHGGFLLMVIDCVGYFETKLKNRYGNHVIKDPESVIHNNIINFGRARFLNEGVISRLAAFKVKSDSATDARINAYVNEKVVAAIVSEFYDLHLNSGTQVTV